MPILHSKMDEIGKAKRSAMWSPLALNFLTRGGGCNGGGGGGDGGGSNVGALIIRIGL